MSNGRLRIELLSRVQLVVEQRIIDRLPTRKIEALLGFLALHSGWQPREKIAEAVWPDQQEGKALASLRNALSVLRRVFEPNGVTASSALETTRTHVRLSREHCECDVWEFQDAVARRANAAAISVYAGDLLPDLFEEWLEPFRESLRVSFIKAIGCEATSLLKLNQPDAALALAERWRSSDPWESESLRVYVLALAATGRSQAARLALEQFLSELGDDDLKAHVPDVDALKAQIEERSKLAVQAAHRPGPVRPGPDDHGPSRASRLPSYLSRFFGREAELAGVVEWMESRSQLLTIVGVGGIGKTRLAVEASRLAFAGNRDIVFVSLAGSDSEIALLFSLMDALGLRESDSETIEKVISSHLRLRTEPLILVLDNLEQIVKPAVKVVMELLSASDRLKLLCTSRALLGIEGEQLLMLTSLETANRDPSDGPAAAVRMFVDRARNSRADFALTPRNRQDVAALCRELEGLPLAIEIAAGWSGAWSVSEMRANVRDNLLVARKRGHDPRHQSLNACIEWSFELLEPNAKDFLCMLSLFRGGWTLDAAEAVTGYTDAAEMLATLVDRSLVSSSEAEVGMRFRMLESVRDYFRSKLSPSRAADSAKRFASYFKDIAKTLANPCAGVDEGRNHRRLDEERENIDAVAALCEEWLVSVDDALSLFGSLHLHWTYRGQVRIGISCIDRARAVRTSEPGGAGTLLGLQALCILCQGSGDLDRAEETLDEFLLISEHQTDPEMHFRALTQKGNFLNWFGRFGEAEPSHAGALAIARQIGVPRLIAGAHCNLAESLFGLARFDEAVEHWQLATEFDRVTGNVAGEAMVYLGFAESLRGNPRVASRHLELYLKHIRSIGFERGCCRVAYFTALCAVRLNEIATACELVSSVRAVLERESYDLEAVERLCFTKVDEAIHKAAPEFRANAKETLGLEEAMDLASRFLRATNGHETPIASANSL